MNLVDVVLLLLTLAHQHLAHDQAKLYSMEQLKLIF